VKFDMEIIINISTNYVAYNPTFTNTTTMGTFGVMSYKFNIDRIFT
jgi:hypothetical protein